MKKIVINDSYGGFSLSDEAFELLLSMKGIEYFIPKHNDLFGAEFNDIHGNVISRSKVIKNREDRDLIKVVEELGEKANGTFKNEKA